MSRADVVRLPPHAARPSIVSEGVVERAALVGLLLVAFGMRLVAFPRAELGLDGFLSVGLARVPLSDTLDFSVRDVHPPLYYLALRAWLAAAGATLPTARWPSVACGVLTVALAYALVRRLWGGRAGVLAAALLAVSPAHVYMSATVRDFALGLLLSLLSVALFLAVARDDGAPAPAGLAALAVVTALALYTWYLHLAIAAAQVACLLALRPRRTLAVGGALAVGGVAYVPWVAFAFPELIAKAAGGVTVSGGPRTPLPVDVFARSLGENLVGAVPWWPALESLPGWAAVCWLALALGGVALGVASRKRPREPFVLAGAGLALGLAAIYALRWGWVGSDNPSRYLLAVIPFGLLGQVGLCVLAPRGWRWLALAGVLLLLLPALGGFARLRSLGGIPWLQDPALTYVRANGGPGDAVLFTDLAHLGLYQVFVRDPLPSRYVHYAGSRFLWDDVAKRAPEVVRDLAARHPRVWFVNNSPHQQGESYLVDAQLSSSYYVADRRWVTPQVVLKLYVAGPRPPIEPTDRQFGGQIRLSGRGIALDVDRSLLYVALEWQALRKPDLDYTVFVHLADASDRTIAQHDGWPGAELRPTSGWAPGEKVPDYHALMLPKSIQPGEYEVRVGLYRDSNRLALPDGGSFVVVGRLRQEAGKLTLLPGKQ